VDGPSGSGKSTVSRIVAEKLALTYIDTGAMYRAVALKSMELGVAPEDSAMLGEIAQGSVIEFRKIDGENHTFVDGKDVSDEIRRPHISRLTSKVSAIAEVRKALVAGQQRMGKKGNVILDGRDIGTVVFPNADFKFYLDADIEVRGGRRHLELQEKGSMTASVASTIKEMAGRDKADSERADSPLKMAQDAVYIDTTELSIEAVVERIIKTVTDNRCR